MTYLEVIRYLNSFADFEKNLKYSYSKTFDLRRISNFLKLLGSPQESLKVIHIAGSKGKGSTAALIAYILQAASFKVGLYTSPHLQDFRERIRILKPNKSIAKKNSGDFEGQISKSALINLIQELRPKISHFNRQAEYGKLSFFEVYTALALVYFARQKTDFVVLETGLGGRLDATNVGSSLLSVITPISFEHTQKLGKTLSLIAQEKAGIIKSQRAIVISAPQTLVVKKVISARCKKFQATLIQVGKEIKYWETKSGFNIQGQLGVYKNLRLPLLGRHQFANAALAVGAVEVLINFGFKISDCQIRRGLSQALWPGRCEVISKNPVVVLDGAQNLASAKILKQAVKDFFSYKKLILVLGISRDKDLLGICKVLGSLADLVILTCASSLRATPPEMLAKYFKAKTYLTKSVKAAKILAGNLAQKNDLILVSGSLFVVGEYRNA